MDFTLTSYRTLINTLQKQGFSFLTFREFVSNPTRRVVILRHDVDSLPRNSLQFARIQAEKEIRGTYYFRIVPGSFDEKIIKEIYLLGHEVGYHYEDVSLIAEIQNSKFKIQNEEEYKNYERYLVGIAIESFRENLEKLRKIVPVKTICMHGSPMSRWDSRLLWKYYDYRDFGIVGEPYFDVNFDEVLYLTDTGRRWDGDSYNIRDRATGDRRRATGEEKKGRGGEKEKGGEENRDLETKRLRDDDTIIRPSISQSLSSLVTLEPSDRRTIAPSSFHSTFDIIRAAEEGKLPDKIMMTFHPQRWTDKPVPWMKELVWQNSKNVIKYFVVKVRQ